MLVECNQAANRLGVQLVEQEKSRWTIAFKNTVWCNGINFSLRQPLGFHLRNDLPLCFAYHQGFCLSNRIGKQFLMMT